MIHCKKYDNKHIETYCILGFSVVKRPQINVRYNLQNSVDHLPCLSTFQLGFGVS